MAISNAIQELKNRVSSAYDACEEKGAELPEVKNTSNLPDCIRSISGGQPTPPRPTPSYDDVCIEVEFCKNKLVAEGGKGSYVGAWLCLRHSGIDYEDFTLGDSGVVAVRTSDGAFYDFANDGANVSHHWDNTKDFDIDGIEMGHKFNWVIYYYSSDTIVSNSDDLDCLKATNIVYVFDMELKFHSLTDGTAENKFGLSRRNETVHSFDFVNQHRCTGETPTDFSYFCYECCSLVKLPDGLDTSEGTDFHCFCGYCYTLVKLPDGLDTSKGTSFASFCSGCYSLSKLPDGMATGLGTNFRYFCGNCYALRELPDNLDTGNGTEFTYFCRSCYSLVKLPDNLDTGNGTSFEDFCASCYSLTSLPENLDTGNGTNFQEFCYYCYSLVKLPDNLDTSNGTNFHGFCYSCYSLVKLPDNLDTSKGTDFSSFCYYCYSLVKLPDNLDTSNGTEFGGFCAYCKALVELPDGLDTSNGTKFGSFCYYCYSLVKLPAVLDLSKGTSFSTFCYFCVSLKRANIILPAGYNLENLHKGNYLTVASMRFIADNAPTTSGRKLVIGSTNKARANKYDPTIITTLTSKGWTVS